MKPVRNVQAIGIMGDGETVVVTDVHDCLSRSFRLAILFPDVSTDVRNQLLGRAHYESISKVIYLEDLFTVLCGLKDFGMSLEGFRNAFTQLSRKPDDRNEVAEMFRDLVQRPGDLSDKLNAKFPEPDHSDIPF